MAVLFGRAHRQSTGEVDDDVPQPNARHTLAGEADAADALLVLGHGIVTNADRAELQHILDGLFDA